MTEAEWLVCNDAQPMLELLHGKASDRKLRLFAVACCRRLEPLFTHDDLFKSLEVAERFAEGKARGEELRTADELSMWAGDDASWHSMQKAMAAWAVVVTVCKDSMSAARRAVSEVQRVYAEDEAERETERFAQCDLLRHIIGNPFRPYSAPDRFPATVGQLADALYNGEDCGFALHDALLDAGHPGLAQHFREEKEHPKGCWAVDMLLGKE